MEHLSLLVLLLALAAGLVTVTAAAQRVHSRPTAFFRAFLRNILLFNLLVAAGLVFRYAGLHLERGEAPILGLLAAMAILKLAWLHAFAAMSRLLPGEELPAGFHQRFLLLAAGLLLGLAGLSAAGLVFGKPALLELANMLVEAATIGGASAAAAGLLLRAKKIPALSRRRPLRLFGGVHLLLLTAMAGSLVLGWLGSPGPASYLGLANGLLFALYNLLPLAWIRRYLPAAPGSPEEAADLVGLTQREREIVELIATGKTNREIAERLFISLATVKDHVSNAFRKTGVRNRVELTNLFRGRR